MAGVVLIFGPSVAVGLTTSRLRDRRLRRVAASRDPSVAFATHPQAIELLRKATGPTDTVRDMVALIYDAAQQGAPADVLTAALRRQGRG